jgi:hypothetical protein
MLPRSSVSRPGQSRSLPRSIHRYRTDLGPRRLLSFLCPRIAYDQQKLKHRRTVKITKEMLSSQTAQNPKYELPSLTIMARLRSPAAETRYDTPSSIMFPEGHPHPSKYKTKFEDIWNEMGRLSVNFKSDFHHRGALIFKPKNKPQLLLPHLESAHADALEEGYVFTIERCAYVATEAREGVTHWVSHHEKRPFVWEEINTAEYAAKYWSLYKVVVDVVCQQDILTEAWYEKFRANESQA